MSYSDLLRGTIQGAEYQPTTSPDVGPAPQAPTNDELYQKYYGSGQDWKFLLKGGSAHGAWEMSRVGLKKFGISPKVLDPLGIGDKIFGNQSKNKWYRDYRKWGEYLRTNAEYSLGTNGQAYDPLAGIQRGITQEIRTPGMTSEAGVRATVNSQTANGQRQMENYASSMGAPGAMQGMIAASGKLRQSMADKAVATYMPQAWAQNEQYSNEISAMLQSLAKSEFETAQTVKSTGRSV